jgi:hypothetical protein
MRRRRLAQTAEGASIEVEQTIDFVEFTIALEGDDLDRA